MISERGRQAQHVDLFCRSEDGRHVYDADFEFDVRMDIDGDWPSDEARIKYVDMVVSILNAARLSVEPKVRREYHANGTYWSGVPTMDMPCDFCARPFVHHDPQTHACSSEKVVPLTGVEFLQTWMRTPNPMLGDVAPLDMLKMGNGHRLAQFIEQAYEAERRPEPPRE